MAVKPTRSGAAGPPNADSMFLKARLATRRRGYKWGEGSTVGGTNLPMCRDAERAGGEPYKSYRIYRKAL